MTISELIEKLEKVKAEHGDLEVKRLNYDDESMNVHEKVEEVYFRSHDDDPDTTMYRIIHGIPSNPFKKRNTDGFIVID